MIRYILASKYKHFCLSMFVFLLFSQTTAHANQHNVSDIILQQPNGFLWLAQNIISLKAAAQNMVKQYGGKVIKAEDVTVNGKKLYKIRLLNNGHVKELLVEPTTGKPIA